MKNKYYWLTLVIAGLIFIIFNGVICLSVFTRIFAEKDYSDVRFTVGDSADSVTLYIMKYRYGLLGQQEVLSTRPFDRLCGTSFGEKVASRENEPLFYKYDKDTLYISGLMFKDSSGQIKKEGLTIRLAEESGINAYNYADLGYSIF